MRLSTKQRIEILMMIGYGDRVRTQHDVCVLFNHKYPDRPINQSVVSKIEKKFQNTGSVEDRPKTGRPVINEETKLNVLLAVEENPHISIRQVSRIYDTPPSSVHKVLRLEKWHPYKIQLVHELNEDDPDRRMQFCQILMDMCHTFPRHVENILFSDESTFTLTGQVNRQNCRYWAKENPRWMREQYTQYPAKVCVWAGIVRNRIIGPYFLEETLNGPRYLDFLQQQLIPNLRNLFPSSTNPMLHDENLWFMQDGAPPHYANQVRQYLDGTAFPNRWIGRRGSIEWPPRSPDLNPLDYFLWGHLKNVVYSTKPESLDDLKTRIMRECANISRETIRRVQHEFIDRLGYCQAQEGFQFEHLIK